MTNEINNWKQREGLIRESVWLAQGIMLYREQLTTDPDDIECKSNLAKLLIRSGTDEKMKYVNLLDAKHLFEEVLELFPNNADALYRLGHISYETGAYEQSICYFTKAFDQGLSETRLFRAHAAIANAYYNLGDDENALNHLQKAKEADEERNFTSEIIEIESLITQDGHFKRFVRYSDGSTLLLSLEETERLRDESAANDEAELDLSHFHPTFTGPDGFTRLERKEAQILKYLIQRPNRFISREELLTVWDEDEQPAANTIKSYISKIKRKLAECFPEDSGPTIETKRGQGYRWACKTPTKIIKDV